LEVYLNVAEMGDGIFGAEAAAQHFFKKPAAKLNANEAALIAACLPNPLRYRVNDPSDYVRKRQSWILNEMNNIEWEK
jgi:monofunctional biosynthetic peptidoglycan transglycosylase